MTRTQVEWIEEYKKLNAYWTHDGNKNRPHALLTSGNHSGGFFNSRFVISHEELLRDAAADLLELFVEQGGEIEDVQGIIGPQTGATRLAQFMSENIIAWTRDECFWASPAKNEDKGRKSMVFSNKELRLLPGQSLLLCDDVCTTSGSVGLTAAAGTDGGGKVLPFILVLVNRSGLKEAYGKKIVALIDHRMPMWVPEGCPLCKEGSEAIRPKGPPEWARLNAVY